jgi:Fur family peroxide stress response transcriptional regulator
MKTVAPAEVEQRLERLKRACQNTGLRITHQRMEIFREVAQSEEHPDAETIFRRVRERMPTVSHDTVYRTLTSLEEMGLVSRVNLTFGRARYDANCDIHHHFICSQCSTISDLYLNKEIPLPKGIENLGSAESLHLQIRGVCHNCKNN